MRLQTGLIPGALVIVLVLISVSISYAREPQPQDTAPDVYAEALGQANLRSGPGIDYVPVGEIMSGTQYRVLAQHALVPWVLLEVPQIDTLQGWVYVDLVTFSGSLATVPAVNTFDEIATFTPTAPPTVAPVVPTATATVAVTMENAPDVAPVVTATPTLTPTPGPTLTPTIVGPFVTTIGEANIRFGPDIGYPVIVKVGPNRSFGIIEMHTLVPWIHVRLDESPTGTGWIYTDLVDIYADLSTLQYTNTQNFSYPTLTPTPQAVQVNPIPWSGAPIPQGYLAMALGEPMHNYLLEQGFDPYSERMASVFVMDMTNGDNFVLNDKVAYSGMSLTKIPILAAFIQQFPGPYDSDTAFLIANTMMCSENATTNQLLTILGDGDPLVGAQHVTEFMQSLGLGSTFILRQYVTDTDAPPVGIAPRTTSADQVSAQPDLYNQMTPTDMGFLLAGMYQCALNGSGLLTERYPESFDVNTCRRMLHAMDANEIGVFLESGVPRGTTVIHKHGWVDDTHGDAGIVIGPDRAFVFVVAMHGRDWLEFDDTSPVIGELSRQTWNALNPSRQMDAITYSVVPEFCDPRGDPVMSALMSVNLPMPGQ